MVSPQPCSLPLLPDSHPREQTLGTDLRKNLVACERVVGGTAAGTEVASEPGQASDLCWAILESA